jgi:predicted lipoprotein with Yx(FWY)xxD motif
MTCLDARTDPGRRARPGTRWLVGGASLVLATVLSVVPTALPAAAAHGRAVVKVEKTTGPLGTVFVSGQGRALYVDIHDRANHVTCTASCARLWPPLLLARGATRPVAGTGVKGLGTVRRPGHRLQVTWHKMPLYLFTGDVHPGQINGQAVGSAFFVVTPKGVLRSVPSSSSPSTSAPTTGTTPGATGANPATTQPTAPAGGTSTPTSPPATSPSVASPSATSPPPTSPTAPSHPPVTSPPAPSHPPTTSPPATAPAGGGVAY